MSDNELIDLGAASVETKGQGGPNYDDANGQILPGLSDD
jgi:hypothetical protein